MSIEEIQQELKSFAQERDWEQFHTIRNLIFAIVGEVGELAESVQWLGEIDKSYLNSNPDEYAKIVEEVADIFIYILRLSDVLGIDIADESMRKIEKNGLRYTKDSSRGNARKH